MLDIDLSVLYQIANFVVLLILLNYVLYKPIRSIINKRREIVTGFENNISVSEEKISEIDERFDARIKEARSIGIVEKETMIERAQNEEKELIKAINEKAQEDMESLKKKIKVDIESVKLKLHRDIDGLAEAIGQKLLGRSIS